MSDRNLANAGSTESRSFDKESVVICGWLSYGTSVRCLLSWVELIALDSWLITTELENDPED